MLRSTVARRLPLHPSELTALVVRHPTLIEAGVWILMSSQTTSTRMASGQVRCLPFEEITGTHFHYVAAIGKVDLILRDILTQATRFGFTARLRCDGHGRVVFIMLTPRSNSGASNKGLQTLTWTK